MNRILTGVFASAIPLLAAGFLIGRATNNSPDSPADTDREVVVEKPELATQETRADRFIDTFEGLDSIVLRYSDNDNELLGKYALHKNQMESLITKQLRDSGIPLRPKGMGTPHGGTLRVTLTVLSDEGYGILYAIGIELVQAVVLKRTGDYLHSSITWRNSSFGSSDANGIKREMAAVIESFIAEYHARAELDSQ